MDALHYLTDVPSWIYQRYATFWRRAVIAAGWAYLYVLGDAAMGAFPPQWRAVLAACIFVGGLWKPVIAYALFVAAIAYPLYLISVYVMALAIATLILIVPALMRVRSPDASLRLMLMVLFAPLLAPYHLTPLVPLLAGLWARSLIAIERTYADMWTAGSGGALVGGLAALWLKLCAGMAGHSLDLWAINGWTMSAEAVLTRFHAANSLQTLLLLIEPFGGDSVLLLFHLLQILAWAAAGYVVGVLREFLNSGGHYIRAAALSIGPGLLLVWGGYVAVPSWLQVDGPRWSDPLWLPAQVSLAGLVAWSLDSLLCYLQRPVTPAGRRVKVKHRVAPAEAPTRGQTGSPPLESLKRRSRSRAKAEEDIIMIELD